MTYARVFFTKKKTFNLKNLKGPIEKIEEHKFRPH